VRRHPWPAALALFILAGALVGGLGTVPGMGLPGAIAIMPATPIPLLLSGGADPCPRDSAWGFAIIMTWAVGALLPVAWMVTRRWHGLLRGLSYALIWPGMASLGALLLHRLVF